MPFFGQLDFATPTWDVFLLMFFAIGSLLYGLTLGRDRIVVDPGFGFGKTKEHNLALLRQLRELSPLGYPLLAGLSRKSLFGKSVGRAVAERMPASVAGALIAVQRGAAIVRVHDVAPTRDALTVWRAIEDSSR